MPRTILAAAPLALAFVLAACGQGERSEGDRLLNTAGPIGEHPNYVEEVRTMPAGQRTGVMLRAIRDAGRDCQTVTEVTEVTGDGGPATWSARCDDGARWLVAIGSTGTATVTNQAELRNAGASSTAEVGAEGQAGTGVPAAR